MGAVTDVFRPDGGDTGDGRGGAMDEPDGVASTQRYLRAKRTVDDRALNREVFDTFAAALDGPTRLIDVAAGIGTMLERLLRWEALPSETDYTMVDIDPANVAAAAEHLPSVARSLGYTVSRQETSAALFPDATAAFSLTLRKDGRTVRVQGGNADIFEFVSRLSGGRTWDALVAGAFLDIAPGPDAVESLFRLVPGGTAYFPITFDGVTRFLPTDDRAFEQRLERRWHAGMREGDDPNEPRAGSQAPEWVRAAGGSVAAVGGSDWVVRPTESGYPAQEAYFLRHVLGLVEGSLLDDPALSTDRVRAWLATRREQLEAAELTYIAHNLDVVGTVEPNE